MGEAPESIFLVEAEADVDALDIPDPERSPTLADDAVGRRDALDHQPSAREFPAITGPRTDDICYATTNRQAAVKQMAAECDLVLVIGSQNSSNSQRLVDVARDYGADAHLIDNEGQVLDEWLEGKRVVGISSGASAPEELVRASSTSSAPAAPRTSRSSRSCARTSASCCRRRFGRPSPREA